MPDPDAVAAPGNLNAAAVAPAEGGLAGQVANDTRSARPQGNAATILAPDPGIPSIVPAVQAEFPSPRPPDAPPDPFEAAADQVAGAHKAGVAALLSAVSKTSPDAAAQAQSVEKATGIPAAVAARNPGEAMAAVQAQQVQEIVAKHPDLAKWFEVPDHIASARDDLPVLQNLSHVLGAIQAHAAGVGQDVSGILPPGFIFDRTGMILEPLPGGTANAFANLGELSAEMTKRSRYQEAADLDRAEKFQEFGGNLPVIGRAGRLLIQARDAMLESRGTGGVQGGQTSRYLNEAFPEEADSLATGLARFGGGLAGNFPELVAGGEIAAPLEAIYRLSKARSLVSATMGVRAAEWAGKGVATAGVMAPVNLEQAKEVGHEDGTLAGVANFITSSGVMAAAGPVGASRMLVNPLERATASRGLTPFLQGVMGDAGLMGTQNAALVLSQALESRYLGNGPSLDAGDLMHQMVQAGELGAVAGGAFALPGEAARHYHREATAAAGSLETADHLQMAMAMVAESKLNGRSPDQMQSALKSMLGDTGGGRLVYLQGKDWEDHWKAQGIDPVAQARKAGAEASLTESLATGGPLVVPMQGYLQTGAESKDPAGLIAKTRMSPGAMTPEEAGKFHQTAPDEIAKLHQTAAKAIQDAMAGEDQKPAVDAIAQDVKQQIAAARPHWPEATLDAVSQVYARTLAGIARFGTPEGAPPIDPMELHQKLSISAALPESVRSKSFDAIKSLMEKITSGSGAAKPEDEAAMADLAAHAEAVGTELGAHALANVGEMMKGKIGAKLEQPERGAYIPGKDGKARIELGPGADPSTVLHELGHYALDALTDFASRENAPAQLGRDIQTLMDHMGIKDLATWQGMDFEARRAGHEKFAESFEQYFLEGKAPDPELRGVFRKIRNLMVGVYKTIKSLVTLTPEVRNVFDRLLVADDVMAKAREEMTARPIFDKPEQAPDMTPEEFAAYLKDAAAEVDYDRSRLMDVSMRDVERRLTDNWKDEQATVHDDLEKVVNDRPEFKAMLALQSGEWPAGLKGDEAGPFKLDRKDIVDRYGEEAPKQLPGRSGYSTNPNRGAPLYVNEGGIPLDAMASLLGFRSGDELWQMLTGTGNREMIINQMTRREMDRRHPDAVKNGTLDEDAVGVLHGAAQGKRLLRELDSLGKSVGQAPPPVEVLREVADRQLAARDVRSVNPELYRRSEAKAAREVLEALAKGDKQAAYNAQVRRVLNSELYRAASDAAKAIEAGVDFARKFSNHKVREILGKAGGWEWTVADRGGRTIGKYSTEAEAKAASVKNGDAPYIRTSSYLGQIDSLRERFGFTKSRYPGPRESLDTWMNDQREAGVEPVIPEWIAKSTDSGSWRDLSVAQFHDVVNAMRNIDHLGREANKLGADMGRAMIDERVRQLAEVSTANKQRVRKRATSPGIVGKVRDLVAGWDAMLTKLSTQTHIMDGFKEGGIWFETFVRPLQEAATREAEMQAGDAKELRRLADEAGLNDQTGSLFRREYVPEIDDHLSPMNRLMIAAYWGREEGRERLVTAHWTEDQVQRLVLDRLTAKDRDFLHGVWRMFDKKYPDLRAQEQRLNGTTVEKSKALPYMNAAGLVFEGGYIPIKHDPRSNPGEASRVEAINQMDSARGMFKSARTRDSMVKRTSETTGMKLRLDEGVLTEGLREANHRLSHQDVLTDLSKLLNRKDLRDTIAKNHGDRAYGIIRDTIADVAVADRDNLGTFGKVMRHLRTGVPAAAFGFNAMRAFLDIAESIQQAIPRVGAGHLAASTAKMLASAMHFESFAKSIAEKSRVMADRQRSSLRNADEAFKGARVAGKVRDVFDQAAHGVMHQAHLFTDHIVWQAAYDQSLVEFKGDEAKAIAVADSITQDTQSSFRTMDLSKFQRGGEFMKMFTVAYGFFGSVYQMQKIVGLKGLRDPSVSSVGRMVANYLCLYSLPIAIDVALKQALRGTQDGQDKTAKDYAKEIAWEHASYFLGTMPVFREFSGAFTGNQGYGGPAGERGVQALYGLFQAGRREVDREIDGKPASSRAQHGMTKTEKDALQAIGVFFHLPATQVQRILDGVTYAMEHGKNPILPAITGKPPKS